MLPEAHAALALRYRRVHAEREAVRGDASRSEVLLRRHADALLLNHPVRVEAATYLKGDGALTLVTDPPGAEVLLHRYVPRNRRLVAVFERSLGTTPLRQMSLPMGSYLCLLRHPERAEVRYPVHIERREHWDGVAPGDRDPHPVQLPRPEELGPDDCYAPPGWFVSGGDPEAADGMPRRRLWCDGLVFKRFPVTNREYLAFLDDLVARGREQEALRWAPRERTAIKGQDGAINYGRDAGGRFLLLKDAEGDSWLPEWPVINVHFGCAVAYARLAADRTGRPWRLPGELEWEKVARGVDGRFFPWGNWLDPSWCSFRDSHAGRPLPALVDSFPVDESVYGVRGMGGNVEDWCADRCRKEGPRSLGSRAVVPEVVGEVDLSPSSLRAGRGGNWSGYTRSARCSSRLPHVPSLRSAFLGLRLARSYHLPS